MLATRSFFFEIELAGLGIYVTGTCEHVRGTIDYIDLDGGPRLEFTRVGSYFGAGEVKGASKGVIAEAIRTAVEKDYWHELASSPDDRAETRADELRAAAD